MMLKSFVIFFHWRFILILSLIYLLILSKTSSAQSLSKIAVLQLSNRANLKEGEVSYLTSQLQSWVQKKTKGIYQVMTQDNLLMLLPPNQTLEDCIEGECEVEDQEEMIDYTPGEKMRSHVIML